MVDRPKPEIWPGDDRCMDWAVGIGPARTSRAAIVGILPMAEQTLWAWQLVAPLSNLKILVVHLLARIVKRSTLLAPGCRQVGTFWLERLVP